MALQIPNGSFIQYPAANWLDAVDRFTVCGWVRFDTVTTANKQYIFAHYGGTNRFSIRKDSTTDRIKGSVTAGGSFITVEYTTAVTAGTWYHVGMKWIKNTLNGCKLLINGVVQSTYSGTTQNFDYDSGGGTALTFGARDTAGTEDGVCTVENWQFFPGDYLSDTSISRLYEFGWWQHAGADLPGAAYMFDEASTTRVRDTSDNKRHIESSGFSGSVTAVTRKAKIHRPGTARQSYFLPTSAGAPAPNPWTLHSTITHPTNTATLSGLTPGTIYEVKVTAVDSAANESVDSTVVQAEAQSATVVHTPKLRFIS